MIGPHGFVPSLVPGLCTRCGGGHAAEARDEGVAVALANPRTESWQLRASACIERLASMGQPFDAEDVRRLIGDPPTEKVMGAMFSAAVKKGLIQRLGFVQPERRQSHASVIGQWIGRWYDR